MVKARSLLKGKIPSSRSFSPSRSKKKKMTTDAQPTSAVADVTDHMTKLQAAGSWDTDELSYEKHHAGEAKKDQGADGRPSLEDHHKGIFSIRRLHKQHKEKTHPLDWGYPGELSKEEVDCFVSFFFRFVSIFLAMRCDERLHLKVEGRIISLISELVDVDRRLYCKIDKGVEESAIGRSKLSENPLDPAGPTTRHIVL
jgi:hypothetical protein